MVVHIEGKSVETVLNWLELTDCLQEGHLYPQPQLEDNLLVQGSNRLLNRLAWIEGLGSAVKTCTIYPDNAKSEIPTINGMMTIFSNDNGKPEAIIDFHLVTKWKTAADSLLAASLLAPPSPQKYLIIGAGTVARSLVEAYLTRFPELEIMVWNRTRSRAMELIEDYQDFCVINHAENLPKAVEMADIISCATMSQEPVLRGDWISPRTHIDLIGAFTPEMREADDKILRNGDLFVDYRRTTVGHIGELTIPMANGILSEDDVVADFYDIQAGGFARKSEESVTVFKNGGGAHLDLMTGKYIYQKWQQSQDHA
ncbi:MAG: ornithine cyclodeaminase [Paracoccaceae bacterium]|nr:ornithine cyclodeaminase [Paracoccaceae bacterium]MDE2674351.1 ornithine cyclodeaminase [Paracoccaceae bacterium]MXZ51506.1 ornithine cyclodeaminase [Paracoccaceae bacterium]MYF46006.1 ornithine cyclodeaminase [Paracoccaceae bacterium]MYI92374.1 ornithine cyclodeaminase [Paracoccaceae bacterium]